MRTRIVGALVLLTGLVPATDGFGQAGSHIWSQHFGGISGDDAQAVAVDAAGNVLITGRFLDTASFGGNTYPSNGSYDVFLAKYDASGTHLWSQSFGSVGNDTGFALVADVGGNVYVAGGFVQTTNFGGSNLTSAGLDDIFLAKYNAGGVHQWSRRFGSTGNDSGRGLAVDGLGNVFLTGGFSDTVNFDGLPGGLPSTGSYDVFIAKYDTNGLFQWATTFGSTEQDRANDVVLDAAGNVFVAGYCEGPILNMGGPPLAHVGEEDIFLAKFDAGVDHVWSKAFGSAYLDEAYAVATDASSNVVLAGVFNGSVDFGGGALNSPGAFDAVLAKYNPAGTHQWSKDLGGSLNDAAQSVAVDGSGSVIATGFFSGTVDFGTGNIMGGLVDAFAAKFLADGSPVWSRGMGDVDVDIAYGVALDPSGNAYVTGTFRHTVNFGGADLTPYGFHDVFLAKYADTPSGVGGTPHSYELSVSSYPNPFNPRTTVSYTVPSRGAVRISIYDTRGALVTTLFNGDRSAGAYTIEWDGRSQSGTPVSTGVYLARIEHSSGTRSKKMVLLK